MKRLLKYMLFIFGFCLMLVVGFHWPYYKLSSITYGDILLASWGDKFSQSHVSVMYKIAYAQYGNEYQDEAEYWENQANK